MMLVTLLFCLGIIFLAVEVLIPGGILGTIGGLALFGGCVVSFIENGFWGGSAATLLACGLVGASVWFQFMVLPKTKLGRKAFLNAEVSGTASTLAADTQHLVGLAGTTLTPLTPSGYVRVKDQRYEAFSQSGQIPAGSSVTVIGTDNFRLIVTLSSNPPSPAVEHSTTPTS